MPWRENEGKANKVKGSTPEDKFFCSTTDRTDLADLLVEERDQKVSGGLGGVPPCAFRHRSLLKTRLGSTLCRNSQSCHAGPSKPLENKIAAVGSKK